MYKDTSGLFTTELSEDVVEVSKDTSFGQTGKISESQGPG